ncbi:MAG: hypothetical protein QM757_23285 [Paludibaculum sp.]
MSVVQLQHEADDARGQIHVQQQYACVRIAGQGDRRVEGHRGGANTLLGRQERKELIG